MCLNVKADRNAAERQKRWRATPAGVAASAARNAVRKAARQLARRRYQSERRAAVADCTPGGERLRVVGAPCVVGSAAYRRACLVPIPPTEDEKKLWAVANG